ncbi:hypothetical protein LCGC14_0803840 [marine sediment metagenome]|uniref:Uncharacterized protein n=1 Tax=marine sediment metagenome TaxID=412755 RepID=A0A0F9Q8M3_9ZZZZ
MIKNRNISVLVDLEGNFYFWDWTNNFSFVFVRNEENLCLDIL